MRVYPNKFANTLYIPPDLLINAYLNYCSGRGTMHSHLPGTPHTAVTEAAELSETTAQNSDSNTQNRGATTKCVSQLLQVFYTKL